MFQVLVHVLSDVLVFEFFIIHIFDQLFEKML